MPWRQIADRVWAEQSRQEKPWNALFDHNMSFVFEDGTRVSLDFEPSPQEANLSDGLQTEGSVIPGLWVVTYVPTPAEMETRSSMEQGCRAQRPMGIPREVTKPTVL